MIKLEQTQRILADGYLAMVIESFLIDRQAASLSPGSLRFYNQKLTGFLSWCESRAIRQISQITPDELRRFFLELQATHNHGGQHAFYRTLKAFFRWVEDEEIMQNAWKNPLRKLKAPSVDIPPLEPARLEDIGSLIIACSGRKMTDTRDKAIFLFLLDTGVRAAELLNLNITDIDIMAGTCIIRKSKSHKSRMVYFGRETRRALRTWERVRSSSSIAYFQTDEWQRLNYDGLRAIITRRAKMAGIEPPALHGFRRAFALACLRGGVDILNLQKLLGHSSPTVTARYTRLDNTDTQAAHVKSSPVDSALKETKAGYKRTKLS